MVTTINVGTRDTNQGLEPNTNLVSFTDELTLKIMQMVATGPTPLKAAKNALTLARVSLRFYELAQDMTLATLFKSAKTRWVDDPQNPFVRNYVDGNGNVLKTEKIRCHM